MWLIIFHQPSKEDKIGINCIGILGTVEVAVGYCAHIFMLQDRLLNTTCFFNATTTLANVG